MTAMKTAMGCITSFAIFTACNVSYCGLVLLMPYHMNQVIYFVSVHEDDEMGR